MSADGTWKLSMDTPMGARELTLEVTASGSTLTGTIDFMGMGSSPITDGTVNGDTVSWKADLRGNEATYTGTISGNRITGTIDMAGRNEVPFTGTRTGGGGSSSESGGSSTMLYAVGAAALVVLVTFLRLRRRSPRRGRR